MLNPREQNPDSDDETAGFPVGIVEPKITHDRRWPQGSDRTTHRHEIAVS